MSGRQTQTRHIGRQRTSLGASLPLCRVRVSARPLATLPHNSQSRAWSRQPLDEHSLSWGRRYRLVSRFRIDNKNRSHRGTPMAGLQPQAPTRPWQPPPAGTVPHTWGTSGVRASTGTIGIGDTLRVGFTVPPASQRDSSL